MEDQAEQHQKWWEKINQHRMGLVVIIVTGVLVIALIVVVVLGYWLNWQWVGVSGGNSKISTITTATEQPPAKTLWDWMQLLIIPAAIAVGVWWLNRLQQQRDQQFAYQRTRTEREAAEKQAQTEREIATDNQRAAALQAYIDSMSELLLHEKLRESQPKDEVSQIARVRTLTVLPRLDPKRKGSVLLFLAESGLIGKHPIIDLYRADLSRVQLYKPWLNEVNLYETNLSEADLYDADLQGANLSKADLYQAHLAWAMMYDVNLSGADLRGADLHRAELGRANLSGGDLSEADLQKANLGNADLSEATIRGANLSGADLSKANLQEAILLNANLHQAKLDDADLSEATLFGADISSEQLDKAKSIKGATMPDGSIHP